MPSAREPENLARMLHCGGKGSGELRGMAEAQEELEATMGRRAARPYARVDS